MNSRRMIALVKLNVKKIIREPAYLFLMILFPALLTLSFGLAFAETPSAISGVSQFDFMVPGLYGYACIFIIMTVAQAFADDREEGLLKRINVTPTTSGEFMGSYIISNIIISLLQVVIVAVLTIILGFRPNRGALEFLIAAFFIGLLSICSVGLGLITATVAKSSSTATGLAFIFILPQMFFGTFIPMTETTEAIAMFLPSHYATNSVEMLISGTTLTEITIWINFAILAIISIVIVIFGIELFKKFGNK